MHFTRSARKHQHHQNLVLRIAGVSRMPRVSVTGRVVVTFGSPQTKSGNLSPDRLRQIASALLEVYIFFAIHVDHADISRRRERQVFHVRTNEEL